ncbi:MAG: NADH-quinone oxidoreductase subunit NuoH [Phycisphaeraceae bacterium]|nr:NADH-quinone oxidoreductase subunit NuoH [Phycisphaeraceae bacterium]
MITMLGNAAIEGSTYSITGIIDLIQNNIWLTILVKLAVIGSVFLSGVSLIAMFSIWWERKVAGHIQGRLGPMHTGKWHGWSQSLADGIKLIQKEDLIPEGADKLLFRIAPYIAFAPVFAAFVALPFGPQLCFDGSFNNGLLYILAVMAIEVMAVILAGWGSNSKWAIYGAMREACQMVSYEVPLGLSLICAILVAGTLNMVELGYLQGGGMHDWLVFHNPFLTFAFCLFFVASLASCKRAPFDLPESESELVAGFHTEYSGLRFSFFFFAEYAGMFVIGVISAFTFLGGWNSPLGGLDPIYMDLNYNPIAAGMAYASGALGNASGLTGMADAINVHSGATGENAITAGQLAIVNLYSLGWVLLKTFGLIFVQIWIRWTLPRIRIDQVMYTCVKVLLPMSLVALIGNALWIALVPQAPTQAGLNGANWGHLAGTETGLQGLTQVVLLLMGLALLASLVLIVAYAWITRDKHPRKSFFDKDMPVGNKIAWMSTQK